MQRISSYAQFYCLRWWQNPVYTARDNILIFKCCCCVTSVVSDSVRPHRRQPTRLPRPRDSPGKNTGVGCHFLLQCMKVKVKVKVKSCPTLSDPMDCTRLLCPWEFSGKNTGVGCHCLLQLNSSTTIFSNSAFKMAPTLINYLLCIV